ncbi:GNAT family N-acetyltransferase [Actinomyces vulturis]|uniref:GNAT family N-acetyltransferase n=1 Tax=Actinomyces vulturis TaxID=1857645 RepID=UPI000832921C|nr:GNAT family N-acetyltransferase [Actinomyces vulturis]
MTQMPTPQEPGTMRYALGDADDPVSQEIKDLCLGIRLEVFVGEQHVPFEEEVDLLDEAGSTLHILATDAEGNPLGTARLLQDPDHLGQVHLGRLAVVKEARGTGLGARLVREVETMALVGGSVPITDSFGQPTGEGEVTVILSAQEQAMGFYSKLGYEVVSGESYLDAGIPHQDMARVVRGPVR